MARRFGARGFYVHVGVGMGYLVFAGIACAPREDLVVLEIPFTLAVSRLAGGVVPACRDEPSTGQGGSSGPGAGELVLRDLRVFVHDIGLVSSAGHLVRASLVPDGRFQSTDVALLDFEDGEGSCAGGTHGTHRRVRVRVPRGPYRALRFSVGVPFQANHANPATANAPLTAGTLSWGWRGGYKFMRLEAGRGAATDRLHLGSTGCAGTIAHITGCARANRPRISLDGYRAGRSVVVDLDALVGPDASDCMAGADESGCAGYFDALGLGLARGEARGGQRVFRWATP